LQGSEILFRVEDTGHGMGPKDLARLFERFWQARDVDRRGAGGAWRSPAAWSKPTAGGSGARARRRGEHVLLHHPDLAADKRSGRAGSRYTFDGQFRCQQPVDDDLHVLEGAGAAGEQPVDGAA